MTWDWSYAFEILPRLLGSLRVTLFATLIGSILAMSLGLVIAILIRTTSPTVRFAIVAITDFIRSTPLLVQLYLLFFVLPQVGIRLSPLTAGIVGIGVHYACYTAQVYLAGIAGVPREQWEGAKALNMTQWQTWYHVVIPQAVPPVVPPLANYVIGMFKETALLSAITVVELMTAAQHIANYTYRYLEPFTLVGVIFLCLSVPATIAVRVVERHYEFKKG